MDLHPIQTEDEPTDRTWTPNARAFGLFVAVVLILLCLPTLAEPLPLRAGRGLVLLLEWMTGTDFGPLAW